MGKRAADTYFKKIFPDVSAASVLNGELLLKIGLEVKGKSHDIDVAQTHLPELIPVVRQMIGQLQVSFEEKSKAKLFLERKPLIQTVVEEMKTRIREENVTYEWVFALPFRLGYLSRMKGSDGVYPVPHLETSDYYFLRTYLTHENFMKALMKASNFKENLKIKEPTLAVMLNALNNFKKQIYLPVFVDLSIGEMNKLFAAKIIPIGMIRTPFFGAFDGIEFDEHAFPLHDLFHGMNKKSDYANITERLDDILETESLERINSYDGAQRDLLNLFHFLLFHEAKNYMTVDQKSASSLKKELLHEIKFGIKNINKNAEKEVFTKSILDFPAVEREQFIQESLAEYEKIPEEILSSRQKDILEELEKMKFD